MEIIVSNAVGSVRRVERGGRAYLVVPATSIVEGVLNGSQGPLFYPREEIHRNPSAWDGMPLVAPTHPTINGVHVSGRHPDILKTHGIGHIANTTAKDGTLHHEAWFDEEATRRVCNDVLERLKKNEPIELSTGLGTTNEPAPAGAHWQGKPYTHIARNYQPDHLAILPYSKGACSLADGCGVLVNQGADSLLAELDGLIGVNVAGQVRSKVTGWFKRYGAGTGKGDVHEAAQGGALTLTERDRMMGADAATQLAETGHNPPSWVADEGKWERAKQAAAKSYAESDSSYWPAVAHIYERMGGSTKKTQNANPEGCNQYKTCGGQDIHTSEQAGAERKRILSLMTRSDRHRQDAEEELKTAFPHGRPDDVAGSGISKGYDDRAKIVKEHDDRIKELHKEYIRLSQMEDDLMDRESTRNADYPWDQCIEDQEKRYGSKETAEKVCGTIKAANNSETPMDRTQTIDFLVTNCDCWKNKKTLLENKDAFNDGDLAKLKADAEALVAARNAAKKPAVVVDKTKLTANAMVDAEEEMESEPEKQAEAGKGKKKPCTENKMTTNEWLASAPPEVRSAVQNAMQVEHDAKVQIVRRLVANLAQDKKQARGEALMAKPLGELRELLELMPTTNAEGFALPTPNFTDFSGTGAPSLSPYSLTENEQADVLDLETARKSYDPYILNRKQA